MKSPFLRNILLALIPLVGGAVIYVLLHTVVTGAPLLVFKADIGSALLVIGGMISAVLLAGVIGWELARERNLAHLAEMRQAQEEARRRFIRRLDHELKNPLTGLRAALANLGAGDLSRSDIDRALDETAPSLSTRSRMSREPARPVYEIAQTLRDAEYQTERLSRLVADLRKLAELEERPLERGPVDMAEVLEEIITAVYGLPQYANRQIRLNVPRVPWRLPPINGDRDLLGLVFYNLVENALKYSRPGDTVEVRAAEDGRWLSIEVADNGPGIAPEDLPRVFDELYRGTNARGLEGSGLGLALVRRVIERHGGDVSVRSSQTGQKGTVFRVRLPAK